MNNYQPYEVVGRGSETQLQLGENLKKDNLAEKRFTEHLLLIAIHIRVTYDHFNQNGIIFTDLSINSEPISIKICKR